MRRAAHGDLAAVLLRVGSRGVGSRSRRPSSPRRRCAGRGSRSRSCRSRPPATATARARSARSARAGVFVKELEEALLAGRIDVAVHSAKDMTSTRHRRASRSARTSSARIRATRSAARRRSAPGMRIGTASVRRRAQLLALEPTLSVEPLRGNIDTRLRKRARARPRRPRARGLRSRPARARRRDRPQARPRARCCPRPAQGALALQVRAGEEELVARGDDARDARAGSRPSAPVSRSRRRLPRAGRGPPRRRRLTALIAAEDGALDRAPQRRRSGRARRGAARGRGASGEDRRHPAARARREPLAGRLEALGHEVVDCPLIAIEPLGDEPIDVAGYDWVVVTSAERRRELAPPRAAATPRLAAIGPATAEALAAGCPISSRASRRRRASSPSSRDRPGACSSRRPKAPRQLLVDELDADFVPLYRTASCGPPTLPSGDLVVLASRVGRARSRCASPPRLPVVSIGPARPPPPRSAAGTLAAEDGSWIQRRSGTDPAALAAELFPLADEDRRHPAGGPGTRPRLPPRGHSVTRSSTAR